jgi:tRNA modification GTPase
MPVSAITRDGLDVLLKSLESEIATGAGEPLINLRHQPLLMQARESLSDCLISIDNHAPDDLLSVLLTDAAHHLGAVTGETASPDMIERIFHDFCVGK